MEERSWQIESSEVGQRLERLVLARLPGLSRAEVRRLFAEGRVRLGPRAAAKGEAAREGARLSVLLEQGADHPAALPEPGAALQVVLETGQLVVVDKPAGQPSAPLRPGELGTLANALLARYPEMAGCGCSPLEPGLVHRLDNDTSGLLLAARSAEVFETLRRLLQQGHLHKRYLLLCAAANLPDRGEICWPLAPHPTDARRVLACTEPERARGLKARPARTGFRVLQRRGGLALVEARACPALRHQLRAHFAALGHPLAGDALYGGPCFPGLLRHALHASQLGWDGGAGVAAFAAESPLPQDLSSLLDREQAR